jgi:hypothetical protein
MSGKVIMKAIVERRRASLCNEDTRGAASIVAASVPSAAIFPSPGC